MVKQNILFISPTDCFFGAEQALFVLMRHINKDKFSPIIVLPENCPYRSRFLSMAAEVIDLNTRFTRIVGRGWDIIGVNKKLIRLVETRKIKLVHLNGFTRIEALLLFILYLKFRGIPFVYYNHMHYNYSFFERWLMLRGVVVCVSERIMKNFLAHRRSDFLTRPTPSKVIKIYPGIETPVSLERDAIARFKQEFAIQDERIIVTIGAINPRKRTDLFLEIASQVVARGAKVKFFIVGDIYGDADTSYREKIFSMREKLKLEKHVVFTGYREDIPVILAVADLVVHTSKKEALGLAVVEAMFHGKPVIAYASEGPAELIDDGADGYLVTSAGPQEYARHVFDLLADSGKREKMGQRGKEKIEQLFSVDVFLSKFENLYQARIDKKRES